MSKSTIDELTGDEGTSTGTASSNGEFSATRQLRENAKVAMDALRDAGRGASAAASELGEEAYQMGARTSAQIARQVETQPITSVLIAASLGLVAGMLLARR
jgi:ElaB/YqjD/DUF883 family membrane-anchored ribosome-binding protein